MKKLTRNQRVVAITKMLTDRPNKVVNLNTFTEKFNAAKSTVSEDLVIVREVLSSLNMGSIETISGAAGGVKYVCGISNDEKQEFIEELCGLLADKSRIVPGNFIYMTDIMCNPTVIYKAGLILASNFKNKKIDYVVTVETKGIPLAYEVAKILGVQLVVVRRDTKVTEGTTVSINYVSGSTRRIQTMSLAKRAISKGSNCIFIDDFMKAGGTANGIINLLKEFESEVVGIGVLIDNNDISKKMVREYISVIELSGIDQEGNVKINASNLLK